MADAERGRESTTEYSSGDLARATGNTVRTIRFYEEQGLLRAALVSEGGHRRYTAGDLERMLFIGDLRELGLPLSEIRAVLDLRAGCLSAGEFAERFRDVLRGHVRQAEERLERLRRVKRELLEALGVVEARIGSPAASHCPCELGEGSVARMVKVLADAGSCRHRKREGEGS